MILVWPNYCYSAARALILHPKLVVADEPVSTLDVSVAAQVLRLLRARQQEFRLTYIFISHSLPVAAQLASRIAVMRAGQFVESGPAERILREPGSPYTRELLAADPEIPRLPSCDIFLTGPA
jgi:ABC-type glutathione transport system ATPase component